MENGFIVNTSADLKIIGNGGDNNNNNNNYNAIKIPRLTYEPQDMEVELGVTSI